MQNKKQATGQIIKAMQNSFYSGSKVSGNTYKPKKSSWISFSIISSDSKLVEVSSFALIPACAVVIDCCNQNRTEKISRQFLYTLISQ